MKKIKKPICLFLTFLMLLSVLTSVSIASAASATEVTHLPCVKQNDDHWKNYYYNEGNLYDTACGIFSTVNAVGYLTGQRMSVTEVAEWAYRINAFNVESGEGTYRTVLYPQLEAKYGSTYGFTVDCDTANTGYWAGSSSNTLKAHLENGGVAIGHVPGHFIAIVGYDSGANKFHLYDSYGADIRGTNINGGDVWVTQNQLATGQLLLDWFCLLSSTDKTDTPSRSVSLPERFEAGIYMTANHLNMHSSASASGDILATIPDKELVFVTKTSGAWGYATYNNTSGYIRLFYATRVGDLPPSDRNDIGIYKTKSDLNMRSIPFASGTLITTIPYGTSVSVSDILNGWGYTYYNGKTGYINLSYAIRKSSLPYNPGVYQTKSDLNMRSLPSVSGDRVDTLVSGTTVFAIYVFDGWGYISYNGKNGYINLSYTNRIGDFPKEDPYPVGIYKTTTDLNMRATPSALGTRIGTVPKGAAISVTSVTESGWGYTSCNGAYGYVNLSYATRTGDLPASAHSTTEIYTVKTDTASVSTETGLQYPEAGDNVENIKIIKLPDRKFVAGTEYDLSYCLQGMEIEVTYSDGTNETFTCKRYDNFSYVFEFSAKCIEYGFLIPALGENIITVSYGGKSADFTITGIEVENIELIKAPKRSNFMIGQACDIHSYLDGMEIKVYYSDSTEKTYTYENDIELFMYELEFSGEYFDETTDYFVPSDGKNIVVVIHSGKWDVFSAVLPIALGDVDGDGKITITDATEIQKFLAKLTDFNDEQKRIADADRDREITIMDTTEIQRFISGYINSLD